MASLCLGGAGGAHGQKGVIKLMMITYDTILMRSLENDKKWVQRVSEGFRILCILELTCYTVLLFVINMLTTFSWTAADKGPFI